jgi:nucleoid DNA-binding protein
MFQVVYKYLILNKQVNLPGIGHFQVVEFPARLDFNRKLIHAPVPVIQFTNISNAADRYFFDFVAHELQIEQAESIRKFHDFTYQLKDEVNVHQSIQLPGIGKLIKNSTGGYSFQPVAIFENYFPSVNIDFLLQEEPISWKNTSTNDSEVGEDQAEAVETRRPYRWWLAAIVLAAVGVAAIALYYLTNGQE